MRCCNLNAVPGGIPIVVNGKLIGAIGVSGGSGPGVSLLLKQALRP